MAEKLPVETRAADAVERRTGATAYESGRVWREKPRQNEPRHWGL